MPQFLTNTKTGLITAKTITEKIIYPAVLAPSAHNTQPWKFRIANGAIDVYVDWGRHLRVSDPTLRQLYISVGCAIANMKIAASFWGYEYEVRYFPEGEGRQEAVARMILLNPAGGPRGDMAALYSAISQRRTNRSMYDQKALTDNEREAIMHNGDSTTIFIDDRDKIEQLAHVSEEGTFHTLSRKDFREELSHWVRNSWTEQHDGMPGYAMGMPAPMSLVAPMMIRIVPIHIQEAPKTKKQVETASALIVFVGVDSFHDWVKTGESFEQVWLNATAVGLAAMPVVAAIEAGQAYRGRLQEIAGAAKLPLSMLRIGHAEKNNLRATPRRTIDECLV